MLSAVLGSVTAVAAAVFGLEDAVTVVLVVMFVLGDVAAGFTAGSVGELAPGCPAAGPAPPAVSPAPPPGTSPLPVSPAGSVATSGSITTCGATTPAASTTLLAPKTPPAGFTNRADTSDPPVHATPPSHLSHQATRRRRKDDSRPHHRQGPHLADTRHRRARPLRTRRPRQRHARLVVRRARDDEALRARCIRRPAQQNA